MDYSPETLEKQYNALPDDVKTAISSEETATKLRGIAEQNGLLEDRVETLINETGFVMLGLTHPSSFVANLTTKMGISRENAQKIAAGVNEFIFSPIRDSLKKIHNIGGAATPTQTPETAQKTLDTLNDASMQHAEKLAKITAQPPEEIRAVPTQQQQHPYHGGDPYREQS